jgi:hypothetical protein
MDSRLCLISLVSAVAVAGWTPKLAAQDKPIPPTAEPPELREHLRRMSVRPPKPPPSPSVREILDIIRRRPGGPQLLERARRAGARIPNTVSSNANDGSYSVATLGGPRSPETSFSPIAPEIAVQAPLVARVTRPALLTTVAGLGTLDAQAFFPLWATADPTNWGPMERFTYPAAWSPVGSLYSPKSFVSINLDAQNTGWYLINVVATQVSAEIRRYTGTPAGWVVIQTFALGPSQTFTSYPVLLNLAAGHHGFTWVNLDYATFVSEVSVFKF